MYTRQQFADAQRLFEQVLNAAPGHQEALEFLSMLYLQGGQTEQAEAMLSALVQGFPDELLYLDRLATLQARQDKLEAALDSYRALLQRAPDLASTRYNFASVLKRAGDYEEALAQYEMALELGIEAPEQLYSNMAVIYSETHRAAPAEQALARALELKPDYLPALFNLSRLQEEQGQWPAARETLRRILVLHPGHSDALVRLAHGQRVSSPADPLPGELLRALSSQPKDSEPLRRENLLFALGKVFDDSGRYGQAFEYYRQGNEASRARLPHYNREAREAQNAELMANCSAQALADFPAASEAAPVFICGMYRSGSTLLEQMLAAHPQIKAGGEINYFPVHAPLPEALGGMTPKRLAELGNGYLELLARDYPDAHTVTNKRPDNYLYLGLLAAAFPNARFIHTRRHALDTCLSVYFQQFGQQLPYAADMEDIGHYYQQYQQLMEFWHSQFPAQVIDVEYESLVANPKEELEPVLAGLALEWHDDCLSFYQLDNQVSTASFWQVRQPLHQQSAGRYRHYAEQLGPLASYLAQPVG